MDIEFHYYITYILAREAGYGADHASTIAYASQYTDDNNDKYRVSLGNGDVYENYISQTLNILRPKNKLVRIYTCFHFLPGDYTHADARRADGALHLFNTTPGSANAQAMLTMALETGDPYRIGIATHCYADTWAHQNFVGFKHVFGEQSGLLAKATPTIGHADFQHQPDIINLRWTDPRLLKNRATVSNRKRFLAAARSIFTAFASQNGLGAIQDHWTELARKLEAAIGKDCSSVATCNRGRRIRILAYRRICEEMPEYDAHAWKRCAMEPVSTSWRRAGDQLWRQMGAVPGVGSFAQAYWPKRLRIRTFRAEAGFFTSHWYRFQQAVKAHQAYVMDLLHDRYEQIGAAVKGVL